MISLLFHPNILSDILINYLNPMTDDISQQKNEEKLMSLTMTKTPAPP